MITALVFVVFLLWILTGNNCLTYAIRKWLAEGGYVLVRKSLIARFHHVPRWHPLNLVPHFLHQSMDGKITQMIRSVEEEEKARRAGPWLDWLWLWHFDGRVVESDEKYRQTDLYPARYLLVLITIGVAAAWWLL